MIEKILNISINPQPKNQSTDVEITVFHKKGQSNIKFSVVETTKGRTLENVIFHIKNILLNMRDEGYLNDNKSEE